MLSAMSSIPTTGIKGSDVYTSTGDPRVDLSVKCVRGADHADLCASMTAILDLKTPQALEDAFVLAFHTRNIRGGKGERTVSAILFGSLYNEHQTLTLALLDLIPHYGSWRDFRSLYAMTHSQELRTEILNIYGGKLACEFMDDTMVDTAPKTLAAKWAPREGSSCAKFAVDLAHRLFPHVPTHAGKMRAYRSAVANLNAKLNTVEIKMCGDQWDTIEPAKVPGRAGKLYNRAFLNLPSTYNSKHTPASTAEFRHPDNPKRMECRKQFETHYALAAKGEAKVHGADTLFPHEVVKSVYEGKQLQSAELDHLNAVWLQMVAKAKAGGGLGRTIFMSDFSGSMKSSSAGDSPYWVSMALGVLGSQVCSEEFQDRLMTFDSTPTWHHFPKGADLVGRIATLKNSRIGQGLSTDFQKAMDLVLNTLKTNRTKPGQEPENLVVLTDMGWDQACSSSETSSYTGNTYRHVVKTASWQTHLEMIQDAFKRAGEDMWGPGQGFQPPRIVIWNLAASPQTDYHAKAVTPGVAMLSGWSPSQFESLQTDGPRQQTAYEILRLELDNPRYDRIRERIRAFSPA
jgi:Domain of unknown function (DUF2828)